MDKKVIHRVFEGQAEAFADACAIEASNQRLSYQALNAYANGLAHLLQVVGCGPETIVHVVAPSSIELVGAMLAVFKSGGIYLPVDLSFSERHLTQVFTATSDGIVIVAAEWQEALHALTDRLGIVVRHLLVLPPAQAPQLFSHTPAGWQPVSYSETAGWHDNLAQVVTGADSNYLFYTSGSTGEAKAILGAHASLSHFIHWELREFGFGTDTRVSQLVQPTFDASLRDIFVALLSGGTLCIPPPAVKENPLALLEWLATTGITVVHCVPSLFRVLTAEWQKKPEIRPDLHRLNYVLMSGEALFVRDVLNWRSVAGTHTELVNLYGATETTLIKTFYRIGQVGEDPAQPLPIGGPISNTSVVVVKEGQVCKPGEVGELYIKTPFATKGYFRNEVLTRQCFVQNPLQQHEKDIVYKTGDLGRWLPDGTLELVGRLDGQVKVNGIRVELPDVERALRTVAGVTGAVVKPHHTAGSTSLTAYYTGEKLDLAFLRAALLKELNAQVLPSWFIWLPAFPLNLNGKIDKHALPLPETTSVSSFEPPVGEAETTLASCWQEVLGHHAFGRHDSFFGVGGHSLRAIQLVARISKAFGVQLRVADVFKHTTLATQADYIAGSLRVAYEQIQPVAGSESYPLSPAQRRLWILSQFEESNVAYHMPGAFVLEGPLSAEGLAAALTQVVARHEVLRTVFRTDQQGEVRQVVQAPPPGGFPLAVADFRGVARQPAAVHAAIQAAIMHPFELTTGPLLRASLYRVEDAKWVFSYVMHHIISDAWSMGILVDEVLTAYNAYVRQQPYAPAPLRIQYKDYAAWQQAQLSGDSLLAHRSFWLAQFSGELPVLELPLDKKRPLVQTFNGSSLSVRWAGPIGKELKALCQQQESTLFMGLVAALNVLLYRYTRQEDIIIGSPTAGRSHLDLENQIGFYINTLALRTRFNGHQSFHQLLALVRQGCLSAFEHQAYPFDALVDELQLVRDRSRNALYDVALSLQNTGGPASGLQQLDHLSVSSYEDNERLISRSDLLFVFSEDGDSLRVTVEYNHDLFERETIERLLTHFEQLVQGLVANPTQPIQAVDYLSAQEKTQLVLDFNDSASPYRPEDTIAALFEQRVRQYPDQLAVVYEETALTYRDLDTQANRLANHLLTTYRLGPDELVGIMLDRSAQMVIAMLAVLKTGAAYVPIDPHYPDARKVYIMQDTGLQLLLTQRAYQPQSAVYAGSAFLLDEQLAHLTAAATSPAVVVRPGQLAYVIYTSGSTGTPKGVMIEHAGVANTIQALCAVTSMVAGERGLQFASPSFDASVWEIFTTLTSGGTLYIIAEEEKRNPAALEQFITAHQVGIAFLPPAYLQLLNLARILPLKKLITGGEAAVRDKSSDYSLQGQFYNGYGPTEVSICATMYKATQGARIEAASVPIGKPLANVKLYIVDDSMGLLPIGVVGEIVIGGKGVARGYLNNPALTAEKFVPNPFEVGGRLYLTGDLGRWLPDGNIEFIGRKDHQVKVNGYRIELGEIEQTLLRQAAVQEAVAVVKEDPAGNRSLVAYYVPSSGHAPSPESLRDALSQQLPSHMVPGYFVALAQIPINSSGKVDRKRLPQLDGLALTREQPYVAPRAGLEQQLAAIWSQHLGNTAVGATDDFFSLGGSSLKAMRIIKQLADELGYTLPIRVMFIEKSVAGVAHYLAGQHPVSAALPPAASHTPKLRNDISFNQLNYFSAWNMGAHVVVESYTYDHLDPEAFQWAVTQLVQRHEILRTVYRVAAGKVEQWVLPLEEVPTTVPSPILLASEAEWQAIWEQENNRAFELDKAPLFVVRIYQVAGLGYRVVSSLHHILTDGYSAGIIQAELQHLHTAYLQGGAVHDPLPPLPYQYQDFAAWQHAFVSSAEGQRHRAYWLQKLQGLGAALPKLSAEELAARRHNPAVQMTTFIEGPLYTHLRAFATKQGLTLPALLLATLTLFLHQLLGDTDCTLSATASSRNSRFYGNLDVTKLIGFFANVLLIRNTVTVDKPVLAYLHQVQDNFLEALDYDAYPLLRLVEELADLTPDGLYYATGFFNYHNYQHVGEVVYTEARPHAEEAEVIAPMRRAYGLTVTEYANGLHVQFKVNPAAFARAEAPVTLQAFLDLLRQVMNYPLRPLHELRQRPQAVSAQ